MRPRRSGASSFARRVRTTYRVRGDHYVSSWRVFSAYVQPWNGQKKFRQMSTPWNDYCWQCSFATMLRIAPGDAGGCRRLRCFGAHVVLPTGWIQVMAGMRRLPERLPAADASPRGSRPEPPARLRIVSGRFRAGTAWRQILPLRRRCRARTLLAVVIGVAGDRALDGIADTLP